MAYSTVSERLEESRILIAFDFGTTFSGIAWAQTGETDEHNLIQNWPSENSTDPEGKSIDKVPTTLRYNESYGPSRKEKLQFKWGYQIGSLESRYEWFKLGLDVSTHREESILQKKYPSLTPLPTQSLYGGAVKLPAELSIDYLTALRKHAEHMVSEAIPEAALKRAQKKYIITIPAVWSEKAREITSSCAVQAGMGSEESLQVVSEPEAAAIYAIKAMKDTHGLREGDTFVVCDAGGGTVDLISYTISSLRPKLEIEEAAAGSGSACGSTFLNRIFAQFLNKKFRGDIDWENDPEIRTGAMEFFENTVKTNFDGNNKFFVPVHGVARRPGVNKGRLELTAADLRGIFEPVIKEVIRLIAAQIQDTNKAVVKLILLVGGFGGSSFLRRWVRDKFPDIDVRVAQNFQTAVVRGALMKGLAGLKDGKSSNLPHVKSRKARKFYGTECLTTFVEGLHNPTKKERNYLTGGYSVPVLKWFLEKGDTVNESIPVKFGFAQNQLVSDGRLKQISIKIYCWDDPMNSDAPIHRGKGVAELGSVMADIDDVVLDVRDGANGRKYYVVDFDIEMTCLAAKTVFRTKYKDNFIGKPTTIEYA